MQVNFDISKPIYEQIIEEIKKLIIRGEMRPGDKLPSQREMAGLIEVNPNTIQRAYREMEGLALVETMRGKGTFIKEDEEMVKTLKNEMAKSATNKFINEMKSLGLTGKEIIKWVESQSENCKLKEDNIR